MTKLTLISILTLFLLTLIQFSLSIPYKIKQIEDKAGIFYHNLGLAKVSNDYFTLISFINISFYHQKLKSIKSIYSNSLNLCSQTEYEEITHSYHCQESLKLLKIDIPRLESKFETISHLVGHNFNDKQRRRRGIFDGGSYIFNWLFGVPDADDAKFYSESINNLIEKNRETQILMKSQISIISDAITNYNSSAQSLKVNEERLNENIHKFNEFSKSASAALNNIYLVTRVTDHLNLLNQLVLETNEQFDIVIMSILFAKQNILHPHVITPKALKNELQKINLKSGLQFPIPPEDYNNIHKYFSISKLSVIYNHEILIFSIKIPLVHESIFNIYNLIPLPIQYNSSNIFTYIDPEFPYLLLSTTRIKYVRLKDLTKCTMLSEEDYICHDVIISSLSQKPTCETQLKTHLTNNVPHDCPTRIIKAETEIWHHLKGNQWLFSLSKSITATLSCDTNNANIIDLTLQDNGLLELDLKCKLFTSATMLIASSNRTSNYTHFIPTVNLLEDDCCIRRIDYLKVHPAEMETLQISNLNLDELRHAQHKLHQFEEILQSNINKPFYGSYSSWFTILLSIIGLLTFLILLWLCCRCGICKCLFSCGKQCCRNNCSDPLKVCFTNINHNERYVIDQPVRMSNIRISETEDENESPIQLHPENPASYSSQKSPKMRRLATKSYFGDRKPKI